MINTKFWSDGFIVNLDPIERYLYLYFLTNEHTNICGIYELPLSVIIRETGIEDKKLQKIFEQFNNKIYYIDGWIYIKNFSKHQKYNDSVKIGIEKAKKQIPKNILNKVNKINTIRQTAPVGGEPATGGGVFKLKLKLKPELESESEPESESILANKFAKNKINKLLKYFYELNPVFNFGNKTQRKAIDDILKKMSFEKAEAMIKYAISIQGEKYAPTITTPIQLKNKMGDLLIFYKKNKQNSPLSIV